MPSSLTCGARPRPELAPAGSQRTHAWLITAILLGLSAIFVLQLHLDWSLNPSYNYGWLVPLMAGYLLWARWSQRPEPGPASSRLVALALMSTFAALLLPLRLAAKANPDWRLISWAVALSLAAVALGLFFATGGARWARHFAFPVLFCLVAVPWPTQFEQSVVQTLTQVVAIVNVDLLDLAGIAALRHGNVIELKNGVVGVEDACSGIRSLQSTLMLSLFFGEFYLLSWRKRLTLVVAGAAVAFIFNVARTFFLAWIAAHQGIPAISQWHDRAGWAVIMGCLATLWGMSVWMDRGASQQPPIRSHTSVQFPIRWMIVLGCWFFIIEGASELWFQIRERSVTVAPQWAVTWPAGDELKDVAIPKAAADLLHYNEGRALTWEDAASKRWNLFFFKWLPGRTAALSVKIHRPEICLPASGFTPVGEPRSELFQINNVSLPTRAYRFQDGTQPLHVYYCYWDGTVFRNTQEMIEEDWTLRGRFKRMWSGRRERGAQTLEIVVWGHELDSTADADVKLQLARFVRAPG